jgi:hypothetical protein
VKYADELVLLAKEETVLQDVIDRLTEIVRCYGMEMQMMYAWYLINMSICKRNWKTSGRNLRRLALKLIPERQKKYVLIQ